MNEILITSRNNPLIQEWLRLQKKPSLRKQSGFAWVEGEHLVTEAAAHLSAPHYQLTHIVLPDSDVGRATFNKLKTRGCSLDGITLVWLSGPVYSALNTLDSQSSCCAAISLSVQPSHQPIDVAPTLVLDQVQDPKNVGTLLRLCAAFGIKQVYLSTGCASAWGSKSLRAGQGAQFRLNISEDIDLKTLYQTYKQHKMLICTTSLALGSVPLQQVALEKNMVWVFGNEGEGVSIESQRAADLNVHIPMQGGFESLNVASAAAICLWQWQQAS